MATSNLPQDNIEPSATGVFTEEVGKDSRKTLFGSLKVIKHAPRNKSRHLSLKDVLENSGPERPGFLQHKLFQFSSTVRKINAVRFFKKREINSSILGIPVNTNALQVVMLVSGNLLVIALLAVLCFVL